LTGGHHAPPDSRRIGNGSARVLRRRLIPTSHCSWLTSQSTAAADKRFGVRPWRWDLEPSSVLRGESSETSPRMGCRACLACLSSRLVKAGRGGTRSTYRNHLVHFNLGGRLRLISAYTWAGKLAAERRQRARMCGNVPEPPWASRTSLRCAVPLGLVLHPCEPRVVVGKLVQVSERELPVATDSSL
jgi:hypothetical protein